MKASTTLILLICFHFFTNAQSLSDIKRDIAIEHYIKAQSKLEKLQKSDAEAVYLLATILLAQEQTAEAKEIIKNGLLYHKNNQLISVASAQVMLLEGKAKEAKAMFDQCISKAGSDKVAVLIAVGKACVEVPLKLSIPDYGLEKLKEAQVLQPSNAAIMIAMGDNYRKRLDAGNAMQQYKNAMDSDPLFKAVAEYKIGNLFRIQNNCEALTKYYTDATVTDPNFAPAWRELYFTYSDPDCSCNDCSKADNFFKSFIKNAEPGLQTDLISIRHFYTHKEYNAVIEKVKALQQQMNDKEPAGLYSSAAYAYFQLKDYPNTILAMENYLKAEQTSSNLKESHFNTLASAYSETGNYEKAKETWLKYAATQVAWSEKTISLNKAADEALRAKDHKAAASIYRQITDNKKAPTAADYYKLGTALYNAKDYTESKKVFERYAATYPSDWRPSLWMGYNEAITDSAMSSGAAVPHYEKFVALGKSDPVAKTSLIRVHYYLFAWEYQIKKNGPAALAHLDALLAHDPTNADALKYKGLIKK